MQVLKDTLSDEEFMKSKSKSTENVKKIALKNLDKFCIETYGKSRSELITELRNTTGNEKYVFLRGYVSFLDGKSRGTISHYLGAVKSYLWSQGIKTYEEDMNNLVRKNIPEQVTDAKEGLDKETIAKLLDNSRELRKALYLTLLSSGMRVGETLQLRKRDFDFTVDPVTVRIPGNFTKGKKGRVTFISREAKDVLRRTLKKKRDDELIFLRNIKPHFVINEEKIFANLRKKCNLIQKHSDNRRYLISLHSFRSYFITKCEKINSGLGHFLAGHARYMSQYEKYTPEELREFYQKAEPELLIYSEPTPENTKEIEKLKTEVSSLKHNLERIQEESTFRGKLVKDMAENPKIFQMMKGMIEDSKPILKKIKQRAESDPEFAKALQAELESLVEKET